MGQRADPVLLLGCSSHPSGEKRKGRGAANAPCGEDWSPYLQLSAAWHATESFVHLSLSTCLHENAHTMITMSGPLQAVHCIQAASTSTSPWRALAAYLSWALACVRVKSRLVTKDSSPPSEARK